MPRQDYISYKDHQSELNALKDKLAQAEALLQQRTETIASMQIERDKLKGKDVARTIEGVVVTDTAYQVPRNLVQGNHQAYQSHKKRALDLGLQMQLIDGSSVDRSDDKMPNTYTSGRVHYVNAAFVKNNPDEYKAQRKFAMDNDLRFVVVNRGYQMPEEAFTQQKGGEE